MARLLLALLLAGCGVLARQAPASIPLVVDVRPATGEQVVLRVDARGGLHVRASAAGLRVEDKRLAELVAPGTLEITGGEGELRLRSADRGAGFVLAFRRRVAGVSREIGEARGEHAVIRVRGGEVTVEAEAMTMREVRGP